MLYALMTYLRSFIKDLDSVKSAGEWPNDLYVGFYDAGVILLRDIESALQKHHIFHSNIQLHRDLVTAGLDFTARWEVWLNELKPNDLSVGASKVFHEQLLRWSKGALKAWRIWLIDSTK